MEIERQLVVILMPLLLCACGSSKKIQSPAEAKVIDTVSTKINDTTVNKTIPPKDNSKSDSFLVNLLEAHPQFFDSILANKKAWNVQIIYTEN